MSDVTFGEVLTLISRCVMPADVSDDVVKTRMVWQVLNRIGARPLS